MAIRYHCPRCGQLLSIASRLGGHSTVCPTCGRAHNVPLEDEPVVPRSVEAAASAQSDAASGGAPDAESDRESEADLESSSSALSASRIHARMETAGTSSSSPFVSTPALADRGRLWEDDDEDAGGFKISGFERKQVEFDLIPLVDCVFLLLVFYMITASYALQKMIDMAAPAADKKGAIQAVQSSDDQSQSSVVVQIDAQNRVLIDDAPVHNPGDIADVLRTKMNGDQKNILIIEADPRAYHETVVAVTDAAKDLPFQHVRMAVKSAEEE
jgi:biopolymer transport protein ExbD/uncharacterized Zn finger protein (UPF0148 family)